MQVKPWTLGFPTDESPDLSSLISPLVAADVSNCSLVLTLVVTEATGDSLHHIRLQPPLHAVKFLVLPLVVTEATGCNRI